MEAAALDELLGGSAREREESWRYSKNAIRALTQQTFALAASDVELSSETLARIDLPFTRGRRIVVVNGAYSERYSDIGKLESGVRITRKSDRRLLVDIDSGGSEPLHLVYASVPADIASRWQTACEIDLRGGGAAMIEQYVGEQGADSFAAVTMRIMIAPKATLRATCFSDLPDSVSLLRKSHHIVSSAANCNITHAHVGGRFQRIESSIDLADKDACCHSRGVFALSGREHVDIHLDVQHNARDTRSEVFWRGVADQRARGIFHGAISVAAGADGADAKLSNKNLLLSPHAEIDTQPVLEIYADEVKASHGATVGQLDERVMFYLRSRGITAAVARNMLIVAFCREVFDDVADAVLHEHLDALLTSRLPAATGGVA